MTKPQADNCTNAHRALAIAHLNDCLRATGQGGVVVVTRNLRQVAGFNPVELAEALASYDGFDVDNDPYGEHDFGDLTLWGYDLLWKIDYYDTSLKFGSDDPADPSKTRRVLTVMLASDW